MFCNIPFRWKENKKGDKKEKTEIVTMEEERKLQSQQKKKVPEERKYVEELPEQVKNLQ